MVGGLRRTIKKFRKKLFDNNCSEVGYDHQIKIKDLENPIKDQYI